MTIPALGGNVPNQVDRYIHALQMLGENLAGIDFNETPFEDGDEDVLIDTILTSIRDYIAPAIRIVSTVAENDLDADAADGVTVGMVLKVEAAEALECLRELRDRLP